MQFGQIKRREFVTLLGGAARWPLAARAQQGEQMRRIGVLMNIADDDPEGTGPPRGVRAGAGATGLDGWPQRQDRHRWGAGDDEHIRKYAAEFVALAPDVIVANSSQAVAALMQATRTVPIVFAIVPDPVGAGFVDSFARPGGNITGFLAFEYGMSAKWLELLKEVAPQLTRVAMIRDFTTLAGAGHVRCNPGSGAVGRSGVEPGRRARCRGNRARRDGVRAIPEWRSDRDRGPAGGASSRC